LNCHWTAKPLETPALPRVASRHKEADLMIGGCMTGSTSWNDDEITWFESLMHEEDVERAWAGPAR
jgi:hypothetical protein